MVRKLVVVFTSVVLFAAAHVKALGLGEIVVESALNQPLAARIDLLQLGGVRPDQINVQLASERDFARFSIDRESFLNSIRFNVEGTGNSAYVRLTTASAVREPYLSFVLETSWPSGRLLSEHTVLLDLPSFAGNSQAAPIQQAAQNRPQNSFDGQSVAAQSSVSASDIPSRLAAPVDTAPAAPDVISGTISGSSAADSAASVDSADGLVAAPAPQAVEEPTQTRLAANSDTISIGADDTLWDIALRIRPDSSVSVQQTMLALQRLNSEAFIADNINMVRRGQVLRIPDIEQIRALSAREAINEVARQNQLFENRRNVPLTAQPVAAQPSAAPAGASAGRAELSVVTTDASDAATPAQSASGSRNAELDARIAALENELAVQQEEADRVALQNQELTERLGLLEQQIASAQEIIRLRDLELAQLQQSLAQAQAQAEAEAAQDVPADPPTVITMAPERSFLQTTLDTLVANTYALLAVTALIIFMLVYVLLRRNKAAEEESLAAMDGMVDSSGGVGSTATRSEFAATHAAASRSTADESDLDEIFNLAEEADEVMTADGFADDHPHDLGEALEEADALIAHEHYDKAAALLQDAIATQPQRTDLRLKLLEVYVASQDAAGFRLQEAELRSVGGAEVAQRIAQLKSQLRSELDDDMLEDDDHDFFRELSALDDIAEDDESAGAGHIDGDSEESTSPEALPIESPVESDDERVVDFNFDLSEPDAPVAAPLVEDAPEIDSASVEFDSLEESVNADASSVAYEVSDEKPATQLADEHVEHEETDENLLDFDFGFAVDEPENAQAENDLSEPEDQEDESEHAIDFDFALLDDEQEVAPSTSSNDGDVVDDIEFEVDDEDEPLATVEVDEDEFSFDDHEFDLDVVDDETSPTDTSHAEVDLDDELADLRFVDDDVLAETGSHNAEDAAEDDELEFLSDTDEAATKLDLAQAYYEMGDHDGAREILEEVIEEGTEAQIRDARTLLDKL